METFFIILGVGLLTVLIRLNVSYRRYRKEEERRRSKMTPEELEKADYEDWSADQW